MKNNIKNEDLFEISNGEIKFWIEQESSIQIKACTKFNDPVEISAEEAIEIADRLRAFASKIQ